ncbi:CPBP family intramembrane glutamic endopeptidase [Stackebrandtia nassauensis]|uniref:Abortive infection protein n=1 Tax=Stackebrandtia nassauensis (strain DSM 44728 / CIP 108903 / NRRL B-16338 / NBRC 102104 / LLR-40K-21) TaxID=446470 RepID=D3Q6T9_STANL|nr:CPBP family intramembrane glutamic endopeptidase [Stackebrandtia nassauensis]ADD40338.1 Abortive infection protein [Stackebrandtia nassauensis DSM 44728]
MTTRAKGLTWFLVISFVVTWTWILAAYYLFDMSLAEPLPQIGMAFTPALAAIVVRAWITREGFGDAGLAFRWRQCWWLYLAAWLGPLAFAAVGGATAALLGLWEPDLSALDAFVPGLPGWAFVLILMLVVPLLTPIYWGEEFGWTSYLRLRLFPERPISSTLATGLIWAVWHFPLAFTDYVVFGNLAIGLLLWTVSFMFQEIILSWMRLRGGSIWPVSLAHAGNNMVLFLLLGELLHGGNLGVVAVTVMGTVPMALVSLWIIATGRLNHIPTEPAKPSLVDARIAA